MREGVSEHRGSAGTRPQTRITSHRFARSKRDFVAASDPARGLYKKNFGVLESAPSAASRSRCASDCRARKPAFPIAHRNTTNKKRPFRGHFLHSEKFIAISARTRAICARASGLAATNASRRRANALSSFTLRQRDSDFFDCCGTNRVQCTSIRTARIATHSLLGGQHGEESEEGKEGQEEEEGEEEVVLLLTTRSTFLVSRAASQRPARPKSSKRNAAAMATPALVDDGGRRRKQAHPSRHVAKIGTQARTEQLMESSLSVCDGLEFLADALGRSEDRNSPTRHRAFSIFPILFYLADWRRCRFRVRASSPRYLNRCQMMARRTVRRDAHRPSA